MEYQNKISLQWDNVYNRFRGKRLSVWRETATPFFVNKIEYLKYKKVKNILDAGCGDGRNLSAFAQEGFDVMGFDVSSLAIKKCKKIFDNYSNVHLQQGLLEEIDYYFKPSNFDVIICDFVLAHIKQTKKVIDCFYGLVKKKGYILLEFTSVYDPHCGQGKQIGKNSFIQHNMFLKFYTLKDIEKMLKKFTILIIDSYYYTDPAHGKGYHRKKRHTHHSYFVLAQK